jgi:uncharacterized membrane protein YjfL (UPF0719 family)
MLNAIQINYIIASVIFSILGIIILVLAFVIIDWLTPQTQIWKEITERKNLAVAVLAGSFMLAIAIIISAAIH